MNEMNDFLHNSNEEHQSRINSIEIKLFRYQLMILLITK